MFIDLANGMFLFVMISFLFGQDFNWLNLFLTIFFAGFPDVDFVIFVIFRKRFKLASHHIIHYPILLLPFGFALGYWWNDYYGAVLFSSPIFFHFVHDSFNPAGKKSGIRWFWPFSQTLYFVEIHSITSREWSDHLKEEVKGVEKRGVIDEIMLRMEGLGPKTSVFLAISIFLVTFYYFWNLKA